jgi:chromosome segregation ATPase
VGEIEKLRAQVAAGKKKLAANETALYKAQKDLQDAQLDNRVIVASLEQRCHTANQALDKAVEEKRKAEEETNNMYEQVLRMKSESEMLLANHEPANARIEQLQKELGAQQRQQEKVRGLLEDRINALMRQIDHLQGQTRGVGNSRVEEWLEDKVNSAELQCGRLEARVIRSEADLSSAMAALESDKAVPSIDSVGRLLPSQLEADAVWLLSTAAQKPTALELEQLQYDLGTLSDGCKGGTSITAAQAERVLSLLLYGRARTECASSAIQHLRSLLHDFVLLTCC